MKSTLGLLALTTALSLTSPAFAETNQRFGDWTLKCADSGNKGPHGCVMTQLITDSTGEKQMLAVAFGFDAKKSDKPLIAINIPPKAEKDAGMTLQIDKKEANKLRVAACGAEHCTTVTPLPDEILADLKGGKIAIVTYKLPEQPQRIGIPLSLKGFSAAMTALQKSRG